VPLTSIRLIAFTGLLTAAALAATVFVWPRWGRWRFLVRPAGILLTEALLTATVGLVANRSQDFYPTWAALFATSDPGTDSYHTAAGQLDKWLATQPGAGQTQSFEWRPEGWEDWRLAAPPTVTVPEGYLQHPTWRYSAILVIGDAGHAWPASVVAGPAAAGITQTAAKARTIVAASVAAGAPALAAGPTVLVSVTTTAKTTAAALAEAVPGELGRDLRVTGHRWALVTSAGDNTLAHEVVSTARGLYPSVAFVGVAAPKHAANSAHPVTGVGVTKAGGYDKTASTIHNPTTTKTAGKTTAGKTTAAKTTAAKKTTAAGKAPATSPTKAPAKKPATGAARITAPEAPAGAFPSGIETGYFPATTTGSTTSTATSGATGSTTSGATGSTTSGATGSTTSGATGSANANQIAPLKAALAWAATQTPPPLATSAPEPSYLPIPHKKTPPPKSKRPKAPQAPRKDRNGSGQLHP
jgi:hypothetical protein